MLNDQTIRECFRRIASGQDPRGGFLTAFAEAVIRADPQNFQLLTPLALRYIHKYEILFKPALMDLIDRALPDDPLYATIVGFAYRRDRIARSNDPNPFALFALRTLGRDRATLATIPTESELLAVCPTASNLLQQTTEPNLNHDHHEQPPAGRTADEGKGRQGG